MPRWDRGHARVAGVFVLALLCTQCSDSEQSSTTADSDVATAPVQGMPASGMSAPMNPTQAPTTPEMGSSMPGAGDPAAAGAASPSPQDMTPEMNGSAGAGADATADDPSPAPADMAPATPSSGCGASEWPQSGTFTLDVSGTTREYIVTIPDGYDTNTPYKLVFAWHGLGGTADQIARGFRGGYYGLESVAGGSTIFVAGQGLPTSNQVGSGPGWDNMGGRDVAFTSAMLDWLRSSYCIDDGRIFSVGMSYGGIMSNTVGCALGEDFRAIAPMAGAGPRTFGGASCSGQVAAWLTHGNMDTIVSFSSGESSRDHWANANHCEQTTSAVGDNGCVAFDGCDEGFPVHFCEFDGGHTVPSFARDEVWAFFSQF